MQLKDKDDQVAAHVDARYSEATKSSIPKYVKKNICFKKNLSFKYRM